MSPTDLRPRRDWVLVLSEPRPQMIHSIHLPGHETGAEKVSERAGEIVRVGPGEKNRKLEVKEGDRALFRGFLKHANPIEHDERWGDGSRKEYFLMSIDDVLAIIPPDLSVGVFSAPALQEIQ